MIKTNTQKNKNLKTFKVLGVEALKNSYYGNPRYKLLVEDLNGLTRYATTKTNGAIGYEVSYQMEGKEKTFSTHTTKNGSLILDRVEG